MSSEENTEGICHFCSSKSLYTCPQCNVQYCSSKCYKSSRHVKCSEFFYKGMVEDQLKGATASAESKEKMQEILKRLHQEDVEGEEGTLDSDDDEDLAERLKGVNLDDSEALWSKLSQTEQEDFLTMIKEGKTAEFIPPWEPWWEPKALVKEVEEESSKGVPPSMENCPTILHYPPLSQITRVDPSPCVPFNILNVLSSYVWTVRIFNGDHTESCIDATEAILTLSPVLSAAANFSSAEVAVSTVKVEAQNHPWLSESEEFSIVVAKDVERIVQGPSPSLKTLYVASALSDIISVLFTCKKALNTKRKGRPGQFKSSTSFCHQEIEKKLAKPDLVKSCIKKIEFFLSYIKEYPYKM